MREVSKSVIQVQPNQLQILSQENLALSMVEPSATPIDTAILSGGGSMLDHDEEPGEVLSSDENDEKKTDVMSNSINQSQKGAAEKKKAPHFPLRVRKNQQFAKGPDCASIPSSRTQAVDKRNSVDDPETSEQP